MDPTWVPPIRRFKPISLKERASYDVGHLGDVPLLVRLGVANCNGGALRPVPAHEVDDALAGD